MLGSVDLYTDGGFGLPCPSAGCLDLGGSTGERSYLRSKASFDLKGGVLYALTAHVRGNARGDASDTFNLILECTGPCYEADETFTLAADDDYRVVELLLTPASDRPVVIALDHPGSDNEGILLDRVTLIEGYEPVSPTPVPLPAPALLLMGGMGLLAVAGPRRRGAASRPA